MADREALELISVEYPEFVLELQGHRMVTTVLH